MLKNPIEFEINEDFVDELVNDKGEYVLSLYTSNYCDDKFKDTIIAIADMWELESLQGEISIRINVRLRSIYENLKEFYGPDGKIDAEDVPLFDALKKDCQWIVDQINNLEMLPKE